MIEKGNKAAKEGLRRVKKLKEEDHDLKGVPVKNLKFKSEVINLKGDPGFLLKELQRNSEASSIEVSEDEITPVLRPNFMMRERRRMEMNQGGEEFEELTGFGGALVIVFRVICDVIGSIFGYGVLSPDYYKNF